MSQKYFRGSILMALWLGLTAGAAAENPCRIEIVERGSGWPIPLVELKTTHDLRFVSDNNGLIACDAPELMNREVWFGVQGHGYETKKDGFGIAGIRVTPEPGNTIRVELERTIIAKRLGRITGGGIFAESQKLGLEKDWVESGVFGSDSVLNAVFGGKMFWAWGDTTLPHYPLGVFDSSSATTALQPLQNFEPPIKIVFDYFRDPAGRPRGVARMPGPGPTWLSAYTTLRDSQGIEQLVATYTKINPPLDAYEIGLCVWQPSSNAFAQFKTLWSKSNSSGEPKEMPLIPEGHPALWKDGAGKEWLLLGNPFPKFRCEPTFEAWKDPSKWEKLTPPESLKNTNGTPVKPHTGQIAFNEFRKRWVVVFMEHFGKPSVFGELWYAEAHSPLGPWGTAVKVISHQNYTFYNPRLHAEFVPSGSPVLLFEATYTAEFADKPHPTARHNYNQVLYRLDLDDEKLKAAHH